jgi:branched-chain amino acid transport system substrate-binding protein
LPAAVLAVLALTVAACGSDDGGSTAADTQAGGSTQAGATTSASTEPIVIGAAIDETDFRKSFDGPAYAAAQLEAKKINDAGGVDGRMIEFKKINTQLKPDKTRSAALELADQGASVLWVTCDVDLATPAIQVGLEKKMLTVAPCIGTDQMGPKRFGDAGKLAFSLGNVAQDEGAAMAKLATDKGWKTADVVSDKQLVYTQNVCDAFANKFEELGGKVTHRETFTQGDNTINRVVSKTNGAKADAVAVCTVPGEDIAAFVSGLRGLGNTTPIVTPWSLDGNFWLPKNTSASDNIYTVTYASVFGDDPDPEVQKMIDQLKAQGAAPVTGGFVTGAAAVDAIAAAIKENGGDTDGEQLAAKFEAFKDLPTLSGKISFSDQFHSVFGRDYRVITTNKGKRAYEESVKADAPAELSQ